MHEKGTIGKRGRRQAEDETFSDSSYVFRVYTDDKADALRLADIGIAAWVGRWWILGMTFALGLAAFGVSFLKEPIYRAVVVMSPVVEAGTVSGLGSIAGQLGGLAGMAGINLSGDDSTEEAIATLRSRAFTTKFIDEHNLLPVLYSDQWDQARNSWKPGEPPPTLSAANDRFAKSVRSVAQDIQTGLVTLSIDWTDPQLAADWANGMVRDINETLRRQAISQSTRSIDYLKRMLQESNELELRAAVAGLIESEMKKAMVATVKNEFAFKVIDPAVVPEKRSSPNRFLHLILGLSAGFLMGCLIAFARGAARKATGS